MDHLFIAPMNRRGVSKLQGSITRGELISCVSNLGLKTPPCRPTVQTETELELPWCASDEPRLFTAERLTAR